MTFDDLAQERYISLTTFKRDGTPVSTPVWVAGEDGQLLVWTAADSWKVKRIKRDSHVRVAPCSARGKPRGEPVDGVAAIVADTAHVQDLERRKYGWQGHVIATLTSLVRFVRRQPVPESVTLAITPMARDEGGATRPE
jgi:PPOX class probable F420-dependent enzyme